MIATPLSRQFLLDLGVIQDLVTDECGICIGHFPLAHFSRADYGAGVADQVNNLHINKAVVEEGA